jgi:glutathione synthase/RimK-type ligase-like ATP-grasp enzyme
VVTRIALATCEELPQLDDDGRFVVDAFARLGAQAVPLIWSRADAPFAAFDATVIRTCWDYATVRDEFVDFARAQRVLRNHLDLITWNTDKRYLSDLANLGFPVPESLFLAPGEMEAFPEGRIVVKPTVGAGSRGARRFEPHETHDAVAHALELHRLGATALIQPYLEGVDEYGEAALIFFGGSFSHSVNKAAMLSVGGAGRALDATGLAFAENITPHRPTTAELELAHAVIDSFDVPPPYARVDLLPSPNGPVIVEVELVEPSLFFSFTTGGEDRYARAILDSLS